MNPTLLPSRRLNHWALSVCPLHGPEGLLWLSAQDRLFGLDLVTGERRVDQALRPGFGERYAVAMDRWPHRVHEVGAPPVHSATLNQGVVSITEGDAEIASVPVPSGFGLESYLMVDEGVAWVLHSPTRGTVKQRFVCLDLKSQRFGATHELSFSTVSTAAGGGRIALLHDASGEVHVFDSKERVALVSHVPSSMWGRVALQANGLAVVSHQRTSQPGAVAAVGFAELDQLNKGAQSALRYFAVHSQGASNVTFVDGALALHQYGDVTLIATEDLIAAPPGELSLTIDDVAVAPSAPVEIASVTFYGASTGFGFAESKTYGRLRFQSAEPLVVGAHIVIDAVEGNAIRRWHLPTGGAQPLAPESRCFTPAVWSDYTKHVPLAGPTRRRPSLAPPDADHCTSVWYGAGLTDPDVDEGDEPVDDIEALRALDGTVEQMGDLLDVLTDEERELDAELVAVRPTLRFVEDSGSLRLALEFYTRRAPLEPELRSLARCAERLLDSPWGTNYEFDPPRGYQGCVVSIDFVQQGLTLRPLDGG